MMPRGRAVTSSVPGTQVPLLSLPHLRIPRPPLGLRAGLCGFTEQGSAGARPCGGGGGVPEARARCAPAPAAGACSLRGALSLCAGVWKASREAAPRR